MNKEFLTNNKEFLKWHKKTTKEGVNILLTIEQANELASKLYDWYTIVKYPFRSTMPSSIYGGKHFPTINDLTNELTLKQFMFRLTDREVAVLNCFYRGDQIPCIFEDWPDKNGYCNIKKDYFMALLALSYIDENDVSNKSRIEKIKYFISIKQSDGTVSEKDMKEFQNMNITNPTLQHFYLKLLNEHYNSDYTSKIGTILKNHQTDLILRDYIFESVVDKILNSNYYLYKVAPQVALNFIKDINAEFKDAYMDEEDTTKVLEKELKSTMVAISSLYTK